METPHIARSDLPICVRSGDISGAKYKRALDIFRDFRVWDKWALGALFALGAGHIIAGIIFFFAFNWNGLSDVMKFALVQGGMVACVAAWIVMRLNSAPAQAFGIAATVFIGVLLAVFGQVYQTPAAIYTPFILWAMLSLPFALASRSVAHWAVWLAIALFAAMTYIGDGIARTSGDEAARWAFFGLAAALLAISGLYHWLSRNIFSWAQTRWFRLSILVAAYAVLFGLFTEGFWDNDVLTIWVLALGLTAGVLAVIYLKWPTLPALSLTTFALVAMISQFGFRIIFDVLDLPNLVDSFFLHMLLSFGWALCMTLLLAKAFRHYQKRFGVASLDDAASEAEDHTPSMSINAFAMAMGEDESTLVAAVKNRMDENAPWYVEALLGISGVITAVFAMLLLGSFIALFLGDDAFGIYIVFGFLVWGLSVFMRGKAKAKFMRHFINMFVLGGGSLAIAAVGLQFEGGAVFVIAGLLVSLATMWLVRDRIIEFLMALGVFAIATYGLYDFVVPRPYVFACILFTALAVIGLVWPIKNRLFDAAGTAFLLAVPIASATYSKGVELSGLGLKENWLEIMVSLVATLAAIVYLNRINRQQGAMRPPIGVLVPLLLAMAIMPLGSSAALLVVLVGYILGSRSLTLIGIVMQVYFLSLFYYDLEISLLSKSILLVASGLIFVGIWWVFRKMRETVHV